MEENKGAKNDVEENADPLSTEKESGGGMIGLIKEVTLFVILALVLVFPIRIFIAQPYVVSGSSMDPTFQNSNYLIVDQLTYRFRDPERGDVVIFRFPNDPSKFFIKRIIGLPGETVHMANGTIAIVDTSGKREILEETYVAREFKSYDTLVAPLKELEYFVLGDNRSNSLDSRIWGPLSRDLIGGRALLRLLPIGEVSLFPGKIEY